ncbi:c-type cytochrome biogenesis protein CcmI [Meridianimarinicoccus aquatilis]|uniref:C-type cytochrome biogenesis protein CcmI n=1 Tax=Meridianimarinicoccus aquatilis TaxID=2552766 RepID=A0A4R6ARI7_9RHOB|nr:c-type cytochrome biogenesis protein CcmI [Fluviibacterium aquatile]TDL84363.1 c-type cytochrome biogenesis protein CcmI [Fluviibacterium aquatile]
MTFWILIFALAAAVAALLVASLLRRRRVELERADYDIAVYREQLVSVEQDVARGVLAPDAAERARIEISRRILDADRRRSGAPSGQAPAWLNRVMAAAVTAVVLGGSIGLYWVGGVPGYGDLPLKQRLADSAELRQTRPSQAAAEAQAAEFRAEAPTPSDEYLDLIERLRTTVAERPNDPRGLELLARNEAALGNFVDAYQTQQKLLDVLGSRADGAAFADLADMMVLAAGGYVSPEAEAVLGQALARDPNNGPARYYVGLMQAQNGRPDIAFDIWRNLLEGSSPDAAWVPAIREQIVDVATRAGRRYQLPPADTGLRGPDAADMAAAADMSAEERMDMVRGMVANLSDRLANEGGSPAEWARLIGALTVLGDTDRAKAIWTEAQEVFADLPDGLAEVNAAATRAGLDQ